MSLLQLSNWLEKQKVAYHKHDAWSEHPDAVKDHQVWFSAQNVDILGDKFYRAYDAYKIARDKAEEITNIAYATGNEKARIDAKAALAEASKLEDIAHIASSIYHMATKGMQVKNSEDIVSSSKKLQGKKLSLNEFSKGVQEQYNENTRQVINKPKDNEGQIDENQQNSNLYLEDGEIEKPMDYVNDHLKEETENLKSIDDDIMYNKETDTYIIGTNIDYDPENYDWIRQARENNQDDILEKENVETKKLGENDPSLFEDIEDSEFEQAFLEELENVALSAE